MNGAIKRADAEIQLGRCTVGKVSTTRDNEVQESGNGTESRMRETHKSLTTVAAALMRTAILVIEPRGVVALYRGPDGLTCRKVRMAA